MTALPAHWLKNLESALESAAEIPLLGHPPSFPLEACEKALASALSLPELKIQLRKTDLLPFDQLLSGMGARALVVPLALSPLPFPFFLAVSSEDVAKLCAQALSATTPLRTFVDPHLQEGFFHYLLLETLSAVDLIKPLGDLSLKKGSPSLLPKEEALCLDIALSSGKFKMWARLLLPNPFLMAFKAHFATPTEPLFSSALAQEMEVTLKAEVGEVLCSLTEWKSLRPGDCLLLDRCSYDPKSCKGTATLSLEEIPLFRARLKPQGIKLLDYAHYYEQRAPMDIHTPDEPVGDSENEEFSSLSEEMSEPEHLWSKEETQHPAAEELIASEEIPLAITVEVGRIQLALQKVLEMRPGNVLAIPLHPEQGVTLTVGGKSIAKGELVKIGESFGVKIVRIGKNSHTEVNSKVDF